MPNQDGKFAVLMDGTNCFFEIRTKDPRLSSLAKSAIWAEVVKEVTGSEVDCLTLERIMMDVRGKVAKEYTGEKMSRREYFAAVNRRILNELAMRNIVKKKFVSSYFGFIMHQKYRQKTPPDKYIVHSDTFEFVNWMKDATDFDAKLFLITTQLSKKIDAMFRACNIRKSIFDKVITLEDVGFYEKLSEIFWKKVFQITGIPPERSVVIGSNANTDGCAAKVGVRGVFILDRRVVQQPGACEQVASKDISLISPYDPLPNGRFFTFIHAFDTSVKERLLFVRTSLFRNGGDNHEKAE